MIVSELLEEKIIIVNVSNNFVFTSFSPDSLRETSVFNKFEYIV